MTLQFRKAERRKAKLRLGLVGVAGSGKTYSALRLAKGLGGKTALIDSEAGSGDLYANDFDYDIVNLQAPFSPEKYIDAIKAAEEAGYDTIIIDSLSHAWAGEGGLLDQQGKIADKSKSGNSYAAWRTITPQHNAFIEAMLQSKCHIIATMRAKADYSMDKGEDGKSKITKLGLAPVQREGMDYEFTVVLDIDQTHDAVASKDRTRLFPTGQYIKITEDTGKKLLEWLNTGTDTAQPTKTTITCDRCRVKLNTITEITKEQAEATKATFKFALCQPCVEEGKKVPPAPTQEPPFNSGEAQTPQVAQDTTQPAPNPPQANIEARVPTDLQSTEALFAEPAQPKPEIAGGTQTQLDEAKSKMNLFREYQTQISEIKTIDDLDMFEGIMIMDKRLIEAPGSVQAMINGFLQSHRDELEKTKV